MRRRRLPGHDHRAAIRIAIGAALLLAMAAVLLYVNGVHRSDRDPVRGVDVSHRQGDIDWTRVAAQNIGFAYLPSRPIPYGSAISTARAPGRAAAA